MRVSHLLSIIFALLALLLSPSASALPTEDGLYAVFNITRNNTSIGSFVAELDYEKAPMTVANFVGLAEGSRMWFNFEKGQASNAPFYDGITFHRVVAGFVIQGGSPNGLGTDGPGYTFPDEFDPTLRHSKAGILSMANSGPHSNGSQFFVTLNSTPHLDDVHSVFGEIVEGIDVVNTVQQGDVISQLEILRLGADAIAFDVNHADLPNVSGVRPRISEQGEDDYRLVFERNANSQYFVYQSTDLISWSGSETGIALNATFTENHDISDYFPVNNPAFFNVSKVEYPIQVLTPVDLKNSTLTLSADGGTVLIITTDTETLTANYQILNPQLSGDLNIYNFQQEAHRGVFQASTFDLSVGGTSIPTLRVSLIFETETSGRVIGGFLDTFGQLRFPMDGTFTLISN